MQTDKQIFQVGGHGNSPVDGGFQFCFIAGTILCGLMLNVVLALVTAWDNDGQAVFFAQAVAGPAYRMITVLVGMVVLVVGEADRIEDQIIMNMSFINMGGKYKLVLTTHISFANCIPISWASLGGGLPGAKA